MTQMEERAHELTTVLLNAYASEIKDVRDKKRAILFSGGLDSAIVAMLTKMTFGFDNSTLYTIGKKNSKDMINAKEGEMFIGVPRKELILENKGIIKSAGRLLSLIPSLNFLELSYELPLFIAVEQLEEDVILTGQGADELFGGYAKYKDVDDQLQRMLLMDRDRVRLFTRTRKNEKLIASHHGKTLITPFLSEKVVSHSSNLKSSDLIGENGVNKAILRESARVFGLPELICGRKKLAAQYGSGISKVLKKARKKGKLDI